MNLIIAITLVVSALAGGGTVYASNNAVPGDTLYTVKRSVENVRLTLSPNDPALHLEIAGARLNEAKGLLASGRTDDAKQTLKEYVVEANNARELLQKSNSAPGATVIKEVEKQKLVIKIISDQLPTTSPELEKVKSASHNIEVEIEIEIEHDLKATAAATKGKNLTKTPEPKKTETPEKDDNKTKTPEFKKTETPEVKKTETREVKKTDTPEVKTTEKPEVKKTETLEVKKTEKPEMRTPEPIETRKPEATPKPAETKKPDDKKSEEEKKSNSGDD